MKLFLIILFSILLIVNTTCLGYWFGKSIGIDCCSDHIKYKYTNKNKQISNIFKGLLNDFNIINSPNNKKISLYFMVTIISLIVLIVIITLI